MIVNPNSIILLSNELTFLSLNRDDSCGGVTLASSQICNSMWGENKMKMFSSR